LEDLADPDIAIVTNAFTYGSYDFIRYLSRFTAETYNVGYSMGKTYPGGHSCPAKARENISRE
jgi:hypothetical protein